MASITRKNDLYYASFLDEEGQRKQQATRSGNPHEAQMIADLLELPYHLKRSGSEALLLHLLSSAQHESYSTACDLLSRLEGAGGVTDEILSTARELHSNLKRDYQMVRYPLAKSIKVYSSFTGMPPEADLEIRSNFVGGKKPGGGDMKLHLATRLLCELEKSGSPLTDPGHRRAFESAWNTLGQSIIRSRVQEGIPLHSLVRSASTLIEKAKTSETESHPDTNERRLFWYMACCFKKNKAIAPRQVIHEVVGAEMSRPTINRILKEWEEHCRRYDDQFDFPKSADIYDDLANKFMSAEDFKRGHVTYFKV